MADTFQAHQTQAMVKHFADTDFNATLERVFDTLPKDEFIRIDKLEIDLGSLSLDNFEQELRIKLNEKLLDELLSYREKHKADIISLSEAGLSDSDTNADLFAGNSMKSNGTPLEFGKTNAIYKEENIFLEYLKTGFLPWYAKENGASMIGEIVAELKREKNNFISWLQKIQNAENAILRLIRLVPLDRILEWQGISNQQIGDLNQVVEKIKSNEILPKSGSGMQIAQQLSESIKYAIVKMWLAILPSIATTDNWEELKVNLHKNAPFEVLQIQHLVKQLTFKNEKLIGVKNGFLKAFVLDELKEREAQNRSIDGDLDTEIETPAKEEKRRYEPPKYLQENEGLLVDNAGIILIWPFLSQLFKEFKWIQTETQQFVNSHYRDKAGVFLHYLVHQQMPADETELVLNKVLCNIPIEESVFLDFEFTSEEIDTGMDLLNSAAKYWEALRTESGEALRTQFFIRNGILKYTNPHWELNIKKESIDVLIDRLPWGIATIKLPWNSYILNTNW